MLRVLLVGTPDVTADGAPVSVDTRKAIALLAYLAVESSASRDTLTALLWPEAAPDRARATLRRTLSSLRHGVGHDAISADRNRITLQPGMMVDLHQFEAELAATTLHDHAPTDVCPRCLPHLAAATDLYRGDFLAGFSLRDAPDFDDWTRNIAEVLRLRMGEACNRLAMGKASAGDYTGAIATTRRWIELDELHEPAHRLLMLLHAWSGDRPGAIESYRRFAVVIDRDLGVPPLEETTELYEAILDEDLPPAPGVRRRVQTQPSTAMSPPRVDDLIGRRGELATVRQWWSEAQTAGRAVVVAGAPWMGKTRLVEDFAHEVASQGGVVLIGRAFRTEQTIPYGVVSQLLRMATDEMSRVSDTTPSWARDEVSRLRTGMAARPDSEPGTVFGELRMLEGLYESLAAIARAKPVLIVVDDIQWADPASVGLIGYLTRRVAELPMLVVLVAGGAEDPPAAIAHLTMSLPILRLHPLTHADIAARVPGPALAERVIAHTGGVPLLVAEMIEGGVGEESSSVARYLEHRMADLSDLARQVLTTASVLAGICDASLLREVSGRSELEVVEAVEHLIGAGLLREIPDSHDLGFTLDLLERLSYQSISMVRRRLLHRRAAEALASSPRARVSHQLATAIAGQFMAAGDSRAADWYAVAGELARRVHANEEARGIFETLLALDPTDPAPTRLSLGELAMIRGDYPQAMQELTIAAATAQAETLGRVEHRLGELHRLLGRFDIAASHFERAVDLHDQPTVVYADWALLHHRLGDGGAAKAAAAKSLELARESGDLILISRAENVSGVVADSTPEALSHIDRALELANGNDLALMAALNNKAHALARSGDIDSALPLVGQAISIAATTGHRHHEAALHDHLADLHHRTGRITSAEEELTRAVALFADIDAGAWQPEVWLLSRW